MRFIPDATGEVVAIHGTGAEFRAVLARLRPAVQAVVADQVARIGASQTVSLLVYADAATEMAEVWAATSALEGSGQHPSEQDQDDAERRSHKQRGQHGEQP